jgi:FtsH-binding integral membrane protein
MLTADLPHQPPAGKLMYRIVLSGGGRQVLLPDGAPVVIRFKGTVPPVVLYFHILVMFSAMLLSTRGGLEYFAAVPSLRWYIITSLILLFVGGLILGPVVQKYAFGAYWTGWPFGNDLTDNKTAVAFLFWCLAAYMNRRSKNPALWVLIAAIATLAVFMVPHSVLGSELDYSQPLPESVGHSGSYK